MINFLSCNLTYFIDRYTGLFWDKYAPGGWLDRANKRQLEKVKQVKFNMLQTDLGRVLRETQELFRLVKKVMVIASFKYWLEYCYESPFTQIFPFYQVIEGV